MNVLKLGAVAGLALMVAACPADRDEAAIDTQRDDAVAERPAEAPPAAETVQLEEFANSGVTGEVQLTPRDDQTDIVVVVRDARPDSSLPVSLHTGTCEAPGAQVEDLGTVETDALGQGHAQLNVGLGVDRIMTGMHVLAVHAEGQEAASPVACAEIPQRDAAGLRQPGTADQTGTTTDY
jgi:hypothetical protein